MDIREAVPEDNDAFQALQAKCPQGTDLVATTINIPDFFSRVKAYEKYVDFSNTVKIMRFARNHLCFIH